MSLDTHLSLFVGSDLPAEFFNQHNLLADSSQDPQVIDPLCLITRFGLIPQDYPVSQKILYSDVQNMELNIQDIEFHFCNSDSVH